jgi:hypothetical protein
MSLDGEKIWRWCEVSFHDFVEVFEGGFEKSGVQMWFFGGENVVICVVNVVNKNTVCA